LTYAWSGGSTRQWRKARQRQLQRQPLCADCRADGKVRAATDVHHPHELSRGGSRFDEENMISVCSEHHHQRHGASIKGCTPDGMPLDPAHRWNR
jgi:5-methylcytosine-specific restriction enzyme A